MTKPITPDEVVKKKQENIPEEVIDEFNKFIAKSWDGQYATFKQTDIVTALVARMQCTSARIYIEHWLDIEDIYRAAGWDVEYDKPGFNETYTATFTFSRRRLSID